MNNKVNYTIVGLSVLFGIILMIIFSFWLLKPSDAEKIKQYIIYFDESVIGLNIDSSVKYRGIDVGKVQRLSINPNNSEQVEVLISVFYDTPIKVDTVAKLTSQGITGLSYINLTMGSNDSKILVVKKGQKYPVIQTAPSLFTKLESSFGSVSDNLNNTLVGLTHILNQDNQEQFSIILKNIASIMKKIDNTLDDKTVANFQATMNNLNSTTKKLDDMMPKVDAFVQNSTTWENNISDSMNSIKNAYISVGLTMDTIRKNLESGDFNFKDIANDVLPNINTSLVEMQQTMLKIQETLDKHERSPSDIFFKKEDLKKGPGEK